MEVVVDTTLGGRGKLYIDGKDFSDYVCSWDARHEVSERPEITIVLLPTHLDIRVSDAR